MWKTCLPAALLLALILAAALAADADQPELLTNPGFESGDTTGWTTVDGDLEAVGVTNTGSWGAQLTSDGVTQVAETGQFLDVDPSATYRMSAWLLFNDANLDHAILQVLWFDAGDHYLGSDGSGPLDAGAVEPGTYTHLQTPNMVAPVTAVRAHATISAWGVNNGSFSIYIDDASFQLVASAPTPTPTPLATEAPITDSPPPGTPSDTGAPTPAATPPLTPTPTPTPTPRPTPTPVRPPITPGPDPAEFNSLTNGGFEQSGQDGGPYGWRKIGGTIALDGVHRHGGSHSLSLESSTSSTKWAYQTIRVTAGKYYQASAFAMQINPLPAQLFLRISWYASTDGSGEAISDDDSTATISANAHTFEPLTTDLIQAPDAAQSARVRLMLRPAGDGDSTAYFDDVSFASVAAPTDAPTTPSPTPTSTPAPTATDPPTGAPTTAHTPSPTSGHTATPTRTPGPTASPSPTPGPAEPEAFPSLVNGDFEDAREDGTPYAWHKSGGAFSVTDTNRTDGDLALEIDSDTSSTKWAYEAVEVTPGAYYRAMVWAMNTAPGDELLLRISWYPTDNGDGSAIDSADSTATVTGAPAGFRLLDTGSVQAPADARSARIRLLMRPTSAAPTRAFFDGAQFVPASALSSPTQGATNASGSTAHPGGSSAITPSTSAPAVLGAVSTPVRLTNAEPAVNSQPVPVHSSGSSKDWLLALALLLPVGGIAAVLGAPAVLRGRRSDSAE